MTSIPRGLVTSTCRQSQTRDCPKVYEWLAEYCKHCSLFFVGFVLLTYAFKSNFFDETSIVPMQLTVKNWCPSMKSFHFNIFMENPILDEIEPSWQPLEGTHNPVGTCLIVWIGGNHGRSWNLDWTRRKRQRRGTSYAQLGGPTRYYHKL